jgi:alpha-1,2-mannosyltransferase
LPAVAAVAACLVALRGGHVDYDVYVRAGRRVLRAEDLYDTHGELPFTYPPFAALVAVAFAMGPLLWLAVLSALTVGAAAWPTARALRQAAWTRSRIAVVVSLAVCSEPVLRSLDLGQINGLVLGLVLADVLLLPPRWRGVLVGLAAGIKLTPLVLLLHFAVRREWSAVARCLAGFGAAVGVGFLALPSASLRFWGGLAAAPERVGNPGFIDNQSVRGVVERLDVAHPSLVWLGASVVVVVAGGLALERLREADPLESVLVCLLVGVLVSPISWSHHWIAAPALAAGLLARAGAMRSRAVQGLGALALTVLVVGPHWLVPGVEYESGPTTVLGQVLGSSVVGAGILILLLVRGRLRSPVDGAVDRVLA